MKTNNVKPMSICMHLSIRMHVVSCLHQEPDQAYLEFADLLVINVLKWFGFNRYKNMQVNLNALVWIGLFILP